jgi:hypothetical protein
MYVCMHACMQAGRQACVALVLRVQVEISEDAGGPIYAGMFGVHESCACMPQYMCLTCTREGEHIEHIDMRFVSLRDREAHHGIKAYHVCILFSRYIFFMCGQLSTT